MKNGKLQIDSYGNKRWKLNGKYHRLDGPAWELADGNKSWWINSLLHRLDGPAVIRPDGYKRWYIEGINYTEYEFNNRILHHWIRLFKG